MKNILVVDDDQDILESLQMVLEDEDYNVRTASSLDQVKYLENGVTEKQKPDLILLDIFLSGEDGRQFAKKLKDRKVTKDIPIIMISAHPFALRTVKQYGADDLLPKPFDIQKLLNKVEKQLAKKAN